MSSPGIAPPPWTPEPRARARRSCGSRCVNPQPVGGVCADLQGFRCGFGECGARMGHRTAAQETIAALPLRPARPSAGEPARRRRRALRGVAGAPSPGRRRAGDAGGRGGRHRGSRGRGPKPRHAGGNHGHRRDRCRRRGALSGRTAPRPRAGARGAHVPRCASSFARSDARARSRVAAAPAHTRRRVAAAPADTRRRVAAAPAHTRRRVAAPPAHTRRRVAAPPAHTRRRTRAPAPHTRRRVAAAPAHTRRRAPAGSARPGGDEGAPGRRCGRHDRRLTGGRASDRPVRAQAHRAAESRARQPPRPGRCARRRARAGPAAPSPHEDCAGSEPSSFTRSGRAAPACSRKRAGRGVPSRPTTQGA